MKITKEWLKTLGFIEQSDAWDYEIADEMWLVVWFDGESETGCEAMLHHEGWEIPFTHIITQAQFENLLYGLQGKVKP